MKNRIRFFQALTLMLLFFAVSRAEAFSLKRIELYFDVKQKQNEVMVQRNYQGLKAYADILYDGSGILNGYWQVDGLIIERVSRFVPANGKVTLTTPGIPDLPTFDPGYHIVKFIVTNPPASFEVPEVVYWVKGIEEPSRKALTLIGPKDGATITPDAIFEWEKMNNASVYLISFTKPDQKKVCFSALTRDTSYYVPASVLADYLCPGQKYFWSVKGYDKGKNMIAESGAWRFSFRDSVKP